MSKLTWYWKLLAFLILAGVVYGALLALYTSGVNAGKLEGDKAGYKRGWDEQQVEVNKLTKLINDERDATTKKVSALEANALVLQAKNNEFQLATQRRVDNAIATFQTEHPQIATSCGLAIESVATLRTMMGVKP